MFDEAEETSCDAASASAPKKLTTLERLQRSRARAVDIIAHAEMDLVEIDRVIDMIVADPSVAEHYEMIRKIV